MYDLGDYPGVVLSPSGGTIQAELHRIDRNSILTVLDDFERFRPAEPEPFDRRTGRGSLYVRKAILAADVRAWVYLWNGPTAGARQIAAGDWKHG